MAHRTHRASSSADNPSSRRTLSLPSNKTCTDSSCVKPTLLESSQASDLCCAILVPIPHKITLPSWVRKTRAKPDAMPWTMRIRPTVESLRLFAASNLVVPCCSFPRCLMSERMSVGAGHGKYFGGVRASLLVL